MYIKLLNHDLATRGAGPYHLHQQLTPTLEPSEETTSIRRYHLTKLIITLPKSFGIFSFNFINIESFDMMKAILNAPLKVHDQAQCSEAAADAKMHRSYYCYYSCCSH